MSFNDGEPSSVTADNSIFSILKESLRGSDRDFTKGPILPALIILAIPMILEMSMESLFAIVDTFFVAKLGAEQVAVVGFTESVLVLIYAVAIGLSIGATATVARRTGEKDMDGAARSATHIIYLGVIVSIVMGLLGVIFAPNILHLLGAEPNVIQLGTPFFRIMFGSNAVIVFLFLLNAIFRGAGDAAIALRVLIIANGLNIILDPMFIFGIGFFPELGVTGAAVATVIGRSFGVLYASWASVCPEQRRTHRSSSTTLEIRPETSLGTYSDIVNRYLAIFDLDGELDRIGHYPCGFWNRRSCRIPDRAACDRLRYFAGSRFGKCRSNSCRSKSRRERTRPSRTICLDGRFPECRFARFGRTVFHYLSRLGHFDIYDRTGCSSDRNRLPADRRLWLCALWARDGYGICFQWGRRYDHSDLA